ncbi:MAG TPA: DUF2933 domain-containing protein [Burkholderiales bacterium]|nr:DUF2933 domain-containing protein [Burkholderiales bacterium]
MDHDHGQDNTSSKSIGKFVLIGFALIAGYFLITEHRAHVIPYLPFLLLLVCPLLHMFHGHGGHGGHGDRESKPEQQPGNKSQEPPGHQHH